MQYKLKNWERYQHYKNRNPPWIKLHFELLSSKDWVILSDTSRVLAVVCMLIASRNGGEIDGSPSGLEYLKRVAHLNRKPNLKPLIDIGFIKAASTIQSDASNLHTNATPEKRREEKEKEKRESIVSSLPFLESQFPKIIDALKSKKPRAKISKTDKQQYQALIGILSSNNYTERDLVGCLMWVFTADHKDADFWTKATSTFIGLNETKKRETETKFDKMFNDYQKAIKTKEAKPQQEIEPQPTYVMKDALVKYFQDDYTEETMLMIDKYFAENIIGKIKLSKAQELIKQSGTFKEFQERICNAND